MATFTGAKILARFHTSDGGTVVRVVQGGPGVQMVDMDEFFDDEDSPKHQSQRHHLANVYYKTNLPLNKHFRHQKCLFRGRFVLLYRATQIAPNLGFKIPGIKAFLRGLTRLKK